MRKDIHALCTRLLVDVDVLRNQVRVSDASTKHYPPGVRISHHEDISQIAGEYIGFNLAEKPLGDLRSGDVGEALRRRLSGMMSGYMEMHPLSPFVRDRASNSGIFITYRGIYELSQKNGWFIGKKI